jgi:hypothetical protein
MLSFLREVETRSPGEDATNAITVKQSLAQHRCKLTFCLMAQHFEKLKACARTNDPDQHFLGFFDV